MFLGSFKRGEFTFSSGSSTVICELFRLFDFEIIEESKVGRSKNLRERRYQDKFSLSPLNCQFLTFV